VGVFSVFRALLGNRATAEANTQQNFRRRQEAERVVKKRKAELQTQLKKRTKQLHLASLRIEQPAMQDQKLSNISVSDVLGFEPKRKRRRH
jgi:hypothetical protein